MGGLLHLVQRGGTWVGCVAAQSILAVPNVTAHPSTGHGHCTNFILFDVALQLCLYSEGLSPRKDGPIHGVDVCMKLKT